MKYLKFRDNIDLKEILKRFVENESSYDLSSLLDEFISVDKLTRRISQYGYNGLVYDWGSQGFLEYAN